MGEWVGHSLCQGLYVIQIHKGISYLKKAHLVLPKEQQRRAYNYTARPFKKGR